MTRDEMIAYIKAKPYHKISHYLFDHHEYIYSDFDGYVYDENGNLFEDWAILDMRWNGIRMRTGGIWESEWYVKEKTEVCKHYHSIPSIGICCSAYSKSKDPNRNIHWAHYPECCKANCPLKHPELLEGRTLQ